MAAASQATPLTTKISTFAFWTALGIVEWLYRPVNPVSRLLHGAHNLGHLPTQEVALA